MGILAKRRTLYSYGPATPTGVTFPDAYKPMVPTLIFDIWLNNTNYPIPGPKEYKQSGPAPVLRTNKPTIISPMGDLAKYAAYNNAMNDELKLWEGMTDFFYSIGG